MKTQESHGFRRHHFTELHTRFLGILPRIELHGRIYFRHLSQHQKADAIQEMRALAWKWFLHLIQIGKNPVNFLKVFTTLLARAVVSGRRLAGMTKSKDAMNSATQRRFGFQVEPLPKLSHSHRLHCHGISDNPELPEIFEEQLRNNTVTPIPDQVQFRIDWPAWLATLTGRERRMIRAMAGNESTKNLSCQFEVSPARISQKRREFHDDWQRFCGESDQAVTTPV
jgi:hypothetical protein